jgi:hypothetical protein
VLVYFYQALAYIFKSHVLNRKGHSIIVTIYIYIYISCRDAGLVKRIGAATALEVRATGINYVFAPCIAVWTQY